jgi:hypothetical protein
VRPAAKFCNAILLSPTIQQELVVVRALSRADGVILANNSANPASAITCRPGNDE